MAIATSIQMTGMVDIELRKHDGTLVERRSVKNEIVDTGLELMSLLLVGTSLDARPIQTIAVGTGTRSDGSKADKLGDEWARQTFNKHELFKATGTLRSADNTEILKLESLEPGVGGNQIKVLFTEGSKLVVKRPDPTDSTAPDQQEIHDGDDLSALVENINSGTNKSTIIKAILLSGGDLPSDNDEVSLSGGGSGLVVSATFSTQGNDVRKLTEAALFTANTKGEQHDRMFNRIQFAGDITLSSDLEITFRWKLIMQGA